MAHQKTGLPFAKGLETCVNLPHTITTAIAHSAHIESLLELSKDKRPPRGIWDKPHKLSAYLDEAFGTGKDTKPKYVTLSEDVE